MRCYACCCSWCCVTAWWGKKTKSIFTFLVVSSDMSTTYSRPCDEPRVLRARLLPRGHLHHDTRHPSPVHAPAAKLQAVRAQQRPGCLRVGVFAAEVADFPLGGFSAAFQYGQISNQLALAFSNFLAPFAVKAFGRKSVLLLYTFGGAVAYVLAALAGWLDWAGGLRRNRTEHMNETFRQTKTYERQLSTFRFDFSLTLLLGHVHLLGHARADGLAGRLHAHSHHVRG